MDIHINEFVQNVKTYIQPILDVTERTLRSTVCYIKKSGTASVRSGTLLEEPLGEASPNLGCENRDDLWGLKCTLDTNHLGETHMNDDDPDFLFKWRRIPSREEKTLLDHSGGLYEGYEIWREYYEGLGIEN